MFCLVKMQIIRVIPAIVENIPQVIQMDRAVEKLECPLSPLLESYLLELSNTPSFHGLVLFATKAFVFFYHSIHLC